MFPKAYMYACTYSHTLPLLYVTCMNRFPGGVTYLSRTKSELAVPHRLMSSSETCIGIWIYVLTYGGIEMLYLDNSLLRFRCMEARVLNAV